MIAAVGPDGAVSVTDQFADFYTPTADVDQSIYAINAIYVNGRLLANFSRGLESTDRHDLSLAECHYFLYPYAGGPLEAGTLDVKKHTVTPFTSSQKVGLHRRTCAVDYQQIALVPETRLYQNSHTYRNRTLGISDSESLHKKPDLFLHRTENLSSNQHSPV